LFVLKSIILFNVISWSSSLSPFPNGTAISTLMNFHVSTTSFSSDVLTQNWMSGLCFASSPISFVNFPKSRYPIFSWFPEF
jgi:hypothetical protein